MSNAARIINNNNSKRHRRRQRRRLLPSVMFCWTQKSVLAVGVVLVLVFFFMTRWRGGSQQQENKFASNNRDKSGQEGLSKKNAQQIILNKEKDVRHHHHPFVDSSFHLSNIMRPKTGQIQDGAARIIERSPPPPPPPSDPLSKTLQQPKETSREETVVETQAAAAVANINDNNSNSNDECLGKERLVQILIDAGMSRENVTQTYCRDLPTWNTVVSLYGSQPVIVQHQCQRQRRRQSLDDSDTPPHPLPPPLQPRVAGLYNTGTNALVKLLPLNLPQSMWAIVPDDDDDDDSHNNATTTGQQEQQQDTRKTAGRTNKKKKKTTYFDWDVPWGKHNPPNTFYNQGIYMPGQANVSIDDILPVIVVKDPYWWMQSMCRNRYGVQWKNDDAQQAPSQGGGEQQQQQQRCPYLMSKKKQQPVPISVHRTVRRKEYVQDYDSLLHLWTDFYSQYLWATIQDKKNVDSPSPVTLSGSPVVDFPFVMVRFEDLLFHAPAVLQAIANCANGHDSTSQNTIKSESDENNNKRRTFSYFLPKSKSHGKTSTDFVSAMIKYGTARGRTDGMLPEDLQFAQQHLQQSSLQAGQQPLTADSSSSSLLQIFHYQTA